MPKNILIVPSRGNQPSKLPFIYYTDTSNQTQEWKVSSGATITLSGNTVGGTIELKPSAGQVNLPTRPINITNFGSVGGVQFPSKEHRDFQDFQDHKDHKVRKAQQDRLVR